MQTIEHFLRDIIVSWRRIRRWQGKSEATYEDDLMHSYKTAMQALTVLAIEDKEEIIKQRLEILTLALNHDVSEACLGGDVIKPIKEDERLDGVVDEVEAEEFDKRFSELPPVAARFLKNVNHIQGDESIVAGRFFEGIEFLGYALFSLAEISGKSEKNINQFGKVLKSRHDKIMKRSEEFSSIKQLYSPFMVPFGNAEAWNIEKTLREIIQSWESSRAWPEFPSEETVLERTMKTAMLASILIPIEIEKRKRRKPEEQIDGFMVLAASLVHNIAKSTVGVLPHRLKRNPKFSKKAKAAREIEREYFLRIIEEFPVSARELMIQSFDLEHDTESLNGRFFEAIKILSYATFALHEYERVDEQYKEVLKNCLPRLLEYSGEFKSFDMFFLLIKHRIESIVEGKSRIWVEVK